MRGSPRCFVVDGDWNQKIGVVDTVLSDIGCTQPRLLVVNKAGLGHSGPQGPDCIPLSAVTGAGIDELKRRIVEELSGSVVTGEKEHSVRS